MVHSTPFTHNSNRFASSFLSISSHNHAHSLFINYPFSLSLPASHSPSGLSPLSSSSPLPCCQVARVPSEAEQLSLPASDSNFNHEIARLQALLSKLASCSTLKEKLRVMDHDSRVRQFFRSHQDASFSRVLASLNLSSKDLFLIKCLVAAGQEHVLSLGFKLGEAEKESTTSSVKRALNALARMIENLDAYDGNSSAGFGRMHVALEDEEIGDLKKLLESLGEIERFYRCIGGIIG